MKKIRSLISVRRDDIYVSILLLIFFIVFANADKGFSFDYSFYIEDFIAIKDATFSSLLATLNGIYIFVHFDGYSLGREAGFVFFIKVISTIITSPEMVYALVAIVSLAVKAYIMRKMDIYWPYVFLVLIYSAVLLEGNALRSGLSLSIFMLSIFLLLKNQKCSLATLFLWLLAISFHLQAVFFIFFFAFIYLFKCNRYSRVGTLLFFVSLMSFGVLVSEILGLLVSKLGIEKLATYMSGTSASTGLNSITIISIFFLIFVAWGLIRDSLYRKKNDVIFSAICSTIPALSAFIFLSNVAVLGDRLWQWGLIILVVFIYPYYSKFRLIGTIRNPTLHIPKLLMIFLLSVGVVNVTVRYQLTNIFYPLIAYKDLTDRSLISPLN
jgi:hypothetical protein